jgi:hypothetical protein
MTRCVEKQQERPAMPFPRMTWAGLLLATLGWGFVLAYPLVVPFVADGRLAGTLRDPARFFPLIGENAIITGLAIAVLGALDRALRLLSKIASHANQPRPQPRAGRPLHAGPAQRPVVAHPPGTPMLMPKRTSNEIVTRGALNGRDYVLFRDGSVVVETLMGPRRFISITEAQEFIGAR